MTTGLQAYLEQQQANQQQSLGNLQQVQLVQALQAHAEKQRGDQALKATLANSDGDVEKALQAAIQSGNINAAHQLAPLVKLVQEKKLQDGMAQMGQMNPDQLDALGQRLAAGGHPGAATVMNIADKRRKQLADAETLKTMQTRPGVAPDPQEVQQSQDLGTPAPQTSAAQPGMFAPFLKSEVPGIASHAQMMQDQLDKSGPNIPVSYWEKARDYLATRESNYLQKEATKRAEPLVAVVKDGKPMMLPREQAVGLTPYSPSIAGAGQFTPEALRMTAEQYLSGDRQAVAGYARNASARIALQNEIVKTAKEKGWSGADIAAQMADFQGILSGSRTVGQRAAQIELASSEANKMIDIVLEKSRAFERTSFVPFNAALKAYETQTGQPEVKAFGAAINSLVNVYARAISPSGVPTVSDKEHAREMLSQADSPAQVKAVMDVMRQEMQAARAAPLDVRASTRRAVTGDQTPPPAEAPAAAPATLTPAEQAELDTLRKKHGRR